jgi:acetate kinase
MRILVINSGSSSVKACVYEIGRNLPDRPPPAMWEARIEWLDKTAAIMVKNSRGAVHKNQIAVTSREQAGRDLLSTLWRGEARIVSSAAEIDAVGHRVVHGGPHLEEPVVITPEVRLTIASVSAFAPLHINAELAGMKIVDDLLGSVPQMAVFDTGFHRGMPLAAAVYPGPYKWFENGIRRYGFHGINHQYCTGRAAQLLGKNKNSIKLVICHLGNGCSLAAVERGRSVDTTMGFTPLDGLMMGTRSGAVDPGILIFLMSQGQMNAHDLDRVLNHQSGLLGISGVSSDMRDVLAGMATGNERPKLAFDIYVHRVRAAIGSMAAGLGGMDAVVFTAGVGENSPQVRTAACSGLEFFGIKLDEERNAHPTLDADIAAPESRVRVLVIRAEEDWAIAAECWKLAHATAGECAADRAN